MLVPLSWLRDYVTFDLSPKVLAEELTLRGMEVQEIEVSGADWTDVVVGRLLSVERHPNADKLWLTRVDVGDGEALQVVCGADNIAPGQLVPVARPGAVLPGERLIERSKIRGVESQGMLCSAIELGIGADAEGIHILGTADEYPLGADLRLILGEVVLDVDVKPNRGDALSMVGLAREIAAFSGTPLRLPEVAHIVDPPTPGAVQVPLEIEDATACPRFTARLFEGINNGASPAWMQRRLLAAGMRPISAVVDVTNYVMHELGQPMHAYDADGVAGGQIIVRRARDGERLTTIDHEDRQLDNRMLVIADRQRPIGLAGIMGGEETEVTASTTRVILESAIFHGPTVRNTARRLGLRSEASMRHEKGVAHDLPQTAGDRAAALILELTGARIASPLADSSPQAPAPIEIDVALDRAQRLLGIALDAGAVAQLLQPLGFRTEVVSGQTVRVTVPPHRLDVVAAEDVAEEIARSHGYGRIAGRLPQPTLPPFRPDPGEGRHRVRRVLAGLGLDEVVTHALIGPADLVRGGLDPGGSSLVRVANPLAEAHSILRPAMYPSLLASLAENVRQRRLDPWLFEVGKVYWAGAPDQAGAESAGTGRFEAWQVGVALLGPPAPRSVDRRPAEADVAELKGVVEALLASLGAPSPSYRPAGADHDSHLHPGRAAEILDDRGRPYGTLGEIDPRVTAAWDLPGRPVAATLNLAAVVEQATSAPRVGAPPTAQPIDRDLAVVLDEGTAVGELLRLIRANGGSLLVEARLFDQYRGPQVGAGKVSHAVALRFQPTATEDEKAVERAMKRIQGSLQHHLGASIR